MSRAARRLLPLLLLAAGTSILPAQTQSSSFLYLWTGSADSTKADFLTVLDVRPNSARYGDLVGTVPVPGRKNGPHHTEHLMPADNRLFANGFAAGQSFIFDLSNPARPKLDGQFGEIAGMMDPHSFLRLPNGNVLATFQMQHAGGHVMPGGLAELTNRGALVRSTSANLPGVDTTVRPYSAVIIPKLDRILTTTTDMMVDAPAKALQLWRLSDLKLLKTFELPAGPKGFENTLTAEPRLLDDGKTVLVSTFTCSLFLMSGLEGSDPKGTLVSTFPRTKDEYCAIPVVVGHYYLVTVQSLHAAVSLDISDPAKPREVSRLTFGPTDTPHWIAVEPNHQRVVITGYDGMEGRVMLANFNEKTGALTLDERFRDPDASAAGVRFDNKTWPHGGSYAGNPHGAVFSNPER